MRNVTESFKKTVAGKQKYKCANNQTVVIKGIENYNCPLWDRNEDKGSFDESGYEIDHKDEHCLTQNDAEDNLQALCKNCHTVKTKRFLRSDKYKKLKDDKRMTKRFETFTNAELRHILESQNQLITGNKSVLIKRIKELNLNILMTGEIVVPKVYMVGSEISNFLSPDHSYKFNKIKSYRVEKRNNSEEEFKIIGEFSTFREIVKVLGISIGTIHNIAKGKRTRQQDLINIIKIK